MTIKQPKFADIFAAHDNPSERALFASVAWAETIAELESAGLVTKRRLGIAERYVLLATEYKFYYSQATHEKPVKEGPNGGDVFSMKWSALLKIGDQLLKLEDSLMISPKSAGVKADGKPRDVMLPAAASKYLDRSKAH